MRLPVLVKKLIYGFLNKKKTTNNLLVVVNIIINKD